MASRLALFQNRGVGNSEIAYIALLFKDLTRTQAFLRILHTLHTCILFHCVLR